ncbi:MAG: hypothetical protein QXG67_02970 [Candidatus Nitrosotenuis sp.]
MSGDIWRRNALHGTAIIPFILICYVTHAMIQTKYPKFRWQVSCEQNSGHTQDEWGKNMRSKTVIAYTVS